MLFNLRILVAAALAAIGFIHSFPNASAADPVVYYAGGGSNTRFHDVVELSDGTILVAGVTNDLNWVDVSVPVIEIPVTGLPAPAGSSVAFLLRLSGNGRDLLQVVHLPSGAVGNLRWIRSTEIPGNATEMVYVSGVIPGGYFIGRLDHNFVDGTPTAFDWIYPVSAANGHEVDQPWDVGNDGRVVFGYGGEWDAMIGFLDPNGQRTKLSGLRASHNVGSEFVRGFGYEFPTATFSAIRLPTDNMSWNDAELFAITPDGNGNIRQGTWPIDVMATQSFETGELINEINGRGYGYTGYRTAGRHWIGSVAVDRRNNHFYYGFNIKSILAPGIGHGENPDFEPAVIAYDDVGAMKWWSRLYTEAIDTNGDGMYDQTFQSTPDQYIDGLTVDYSVSLGAGGAVVVVARCHGNTVSNYWGGNNVYLNPAATGFQNGFTGTEGNIHIGWIGRLTANEGNLLAATYVAGFFRRVIDGKGNWPATPYPEPIHDGWPSHNAGWADLTTTSIQPNSIRVAEDGKVYVVGNGPRMVTTSNAFQKLPRRLGHTNPILNEGSSPWNDWVRAYEPQLNALAYSSTITGQWTYPDGDIDAEPVGASNIKMRGVFPISGAVLAVGHHSNNAGTVASGNDMPTANVPGWGSQSYNGITGVFTMLPIESDRPVAAVQTTVSNGTVSADASNSSSLSTIVSYQWTFGDGVSGSGLTASHAYMSNGTYLVGLKIINSAGFSSTAHQWVTVDDLEDPPSNPPAPSAPEALSGNAVAHNQIDLQWADTADNEIGFKIERSLTGLDGWTQIVMLTANTNSYSDTGLTHSVQYYYRVRAYNAGGDSQYSNVAAITTPIPALVPPVPTNPIAHAVAYNQVNLTWSMSGDLHDGFFIERITAGGSWTFAASVGPDLRTWSDHELDAETHYAYRIFSYNAAGSSDASLAVAAITPPEPGTAGSIAAVSWFVQALDNTGSITTNQPGHVVFAGLTTRQYRGAVAALNQSTTLEQEGDFMQLTFESDFPNMGNNEPFAVRFGLFNDSGSPVTSDFSELTDGSVGFFAALSNRNSNGRASDLYVQGPGTSPILARGINSVSLGVQGNTRFATASLANFGNRSVTMVITRMAEGAMRFSVESIDEANRVLTLTSDIPAGSVPTYTINQIAVSAGYQGITGQGYRDIVIQIGGPSFVGDGEQTFATWRSAQFSEAELADDTISGAMADPTGQGLSNLERYAFGLSSTEPAVSATPVMVFTPEEAQTSLGLSFLRNTEATDVTMTLQASTDLLNWDFLDDITLQQGDTQPTEHDHIVRDIWYFTLPPQDLQTTPVFLRLQVERLLD